MGRATFNDDAASHPQQIKHPPVNAGGAVGYQLLTLKAKPLVACSRVGVCPRDIVIMRYDHFKGLQGSSDQGLSTSDETSRYHRSRVTVACFAASRFKGAAVIVA